MNYTLVVYVPEASLDEVKNALFEAGAGQLGPYEKCCWQVLGLGQFSPMSGSSPYIGRQNELSVVPEYRVEMMVQKIRIRAVLAALHKAHPYEVPAFTVVANLDVGQELVV